MVNIIHHGENHERINEIIQIAQKRFGMYGMEKTSMKEIASDLGMSKGSLYYYFPDKEHLYIHVVKTEQEVFNKKVSEVIENTEEPVTMLKEYVRIRLLYLRKLLNLSRFRMEEYSGIKPMISDLKERFMATQIATIEKILNKGVEKGIFFVEDTKGTADLFLELFFCLGNAVIRKKNMFYLEKEEYDMVAEKANKFTEIFIKGIKNNE